MIRLLFLYCLFTLFSCFGAEEMNLENFLKKYSLPIYQDIIYHNQVISQGTDICDTRFEIIRPILDMYQRPFKLLDLGAAQGYFSFRTAREYPESFCVMIEANTSYHAYTKHGDMLYDLCLLNSDLKNICYLNKSMNLSSLSFLSTHEHFDVVLALLVIHLMYENLSDQMKVIEHLFSLGDNIILEVANEVAVPLTRYVESLSHKIECEYLGEVKRHHNSLSTSTGKLFWFKRNNPSASHSQMLSNKVFVQLNGVYPKGGIN